MPKYKKPVVIPIFSFSFKLNSHSTSDNTTLFTTFSFAFILNTRAKLHSAMSYTNVPTTGNSAQSNDQLADPATSEPSQTAAMTRPQQNSHLLRLPNELLLQIVQDSALTPKDARSVALSSSRLFSLARPEFYKKDRENMEYDPGGICVFNNATRRLDLATLERCVHFGGAPRRLFDPCPVARRGCVNRITTEAHLALRVGKFLPFDMRCRQAKDIYFWLQNILQSFAENRPDHSCSKCSDEFESDPRSWIVAYFYDCYNFVMAGNKPSQAQECFEIIQALARQGATAPSKKLIFHNQLPAVNGLRDAAIGLVHDNHGRTWGPSQNPMTMALQLDAPSALLELTIQMFRNDGVRVRSPFKLLEIRGLNPAESTPLTFSQCRDCYRSAKIAKCPTLYGPDFDWTAWYCPNPQFTDCCCTMPVKTELHQHLETIYCNLFFPREELHVPDWDIIRHDSWWMEYAERLGVEWAKKMDILGGYEVITAAEYEWLFAALGRLEDMFNIGMSWGGFNLYQNGNICWDALFPSTPFPFTMEERDGKVHYAAPAPWDACLASTNGRVWDRIELDQRPFVFQWGLGGYEERLNSTAEEEYAYVGPEEWLSSLGY